MPTNFFSTVNNYGAMLNKLATANFFAGLIAFYFLTTQSPPLSKLAASFSLDVAISGLKIPIGFIILPLVAAIFFRAIKLHDRISSIFKIRQYYDWEYILKPLRDSVESKKEKKVILKNRSKLMSRTFYKYASSRSDNPIIDKHLIEMVLDQLTWYWMMVESSFIAICVFAALLYLEAFEHAFAVLLLGLALIVFSKTLQKSCSKYTKQEIAEILNSHARKKEIREEFDAL